MDEFDRYRTAMNEKLLGSNHLGIKRFFALDTQAYEDGALDKRTKELLGLVASTVLRCDDCITYHIKQCVTIGINREEFLDAFNVALVVGGSITIPHLRPAIDRVDQLLDGAGVDGEAQPHHHSLRDRLEALRGGRAGIRTVSGHHKERENAKGDRDNGPANDKHAKEQHRG